MKKKVLLVLVLVLVVAGGVFAEKKNHISGEVSFFGGGARYEFMLSDNLSVGVNVYYNWLILWTDLGVDGAVRFYPRGGGTGLYIGAGVGYHRNSLGVLNLLVEGAINGVAVTPEIGWKFPVGSKGLFLGPGVKVPITFGVVREYDYWLGYENRFRVGYGVVPYFGIGFAF